MKILAVLLVLFLASCNSPSVRIDRADNLAMTAGFTKDLHSTSYFKIVSYHKLLQPRYPVTIYIEGDGLAYVNRYQVALNPTPVDPVSLRLALLDPSPNVVYIARPCQFVQRQDDPNCHHDYWTIKRYSTEVVNAINEVIEIYNINNELEGKRLVGFSGGGTVAAILAAIRNDVIDLRTVAGNLDTTAFIRVHNARPLTDSLNPVDYIDKLKAIPQYHFIGMDDDIVPVEVVNSYVGHIEDLGKDLRCVFTQTFPGVTHTHGWESVWQRYVDQVITCNQ